ncbi:hypothetical protein NBRC10512_005218 [Rhodotorula toruloides]|uniref:RHTO0S13e01068g1_1 n=2 Tax=Rhodotorula toruloides TaxID=5286 RepID=A0A061BID2_RHOTO|nr:uncharacterized protein RHTO_00818 [Rhodotorula toruloides NP11]EMS22539.1 hypothetical protein RHTO_00818 [Rhodotorula toruloides NP11]CDR46755.1 RHTO0S13e01068g1_1 [Rhodotorula toruloides]
MATLQRPLAATPLAPAPDSTAPAQAFDPSAVPRGPAGLASTADRHALGGEREQEGDLIDLGQERLFTGSRTRTQKVEEGASDEANGTRQAQGGTGSSSERIEGSQELLGSLGAARHAFLFALNGLVQRCLGGAMSAQQSPRPDQATSSDGAPPGFDSTLRRHSLAVPTPSQVASQQPDILLTAVLDTLRSHDTTPFSASPVMLSVERASPLLGSRRQAATPNSALIQELQTRVEVAANDLLPPTEAELARTLASLLSCIERLSSITQSSDTYTRPTFSASPSRPPSTAFVDGSTPSAFYEALGQEAAALSESSREQQLPRGVVGAAREVEQAERDLLWGRVFDLSERVKLLSRQRVEALERDGKEDWMRTPQDASQDTKFRTDSLYEGSLSDLPRYSHDLDSAHQNPHLPPAYYHDFIADDKKEALASNGDEATDLQRSSTSAPRTRQRKVSGAHTEKMQRDFENVTSAIERLYLISPQLANQRVEPDRRALRERQLAKLGNAIERLSQGRLENQRAVPSPAMDEDEQESTPQSRATSRRAREQQAFDRLLDQIDKAASRTLADQRVELSGKRREVLNLDTAKNDFEPLSDKYEARRREYILSHTGKGRLASQDAILRPSGVVAPFPRPAPELEESVTFGEFLEEEYGFNRPRSHSLPNNALEREKPEAAGEKGSLRVGLLKKGQGGIGLGMLDTSVTPSTAADYEVLDVPQVDWIAEESRNLGTLVVTFWPRSSHKSSPAAFEVVAVESSAVLVAVKGQKTASRVALPCRVVPQQATVQLVGGSVCEVKLVTLGSTSPTKSRSDLEVHSPLATDELRATSPTSFRCANCDAELADTSTVSRWNALPSEYWAELLDAWMCHQDQNLSDDLIAKGKGIKPRPDEVLVATSYVLLPRELTSKWTAPEQAEPAKANNGDYLHAAHCASCDALVGSHVLPADGNTSESTTVRLLKYATYPASSDPARPAPPRHTLSTYLTADMLETGQAHACHRFILEDAQTEQAKLLLWFFNPSIRLSFSSSTADANSLLSPSDTPAAPSLTFRSMNSVKVFYAVVENDNAAVCATFVSAKHERIPYPLSVIQRLTSLLQASTLVYPFAKRKFGELDIGFLERL